MTAIGVGLALILTWAISTTVGCACETAATVTVGGEGTVAGAVYIPNASMVP